MFHITNIRPLSARDAQVARATLDMALGWLESANRTGHPEYRAKAEYELDAWFAGIDRARLLYYGQNPGR